MARYIDADAFKQKLADKGIFFPALYKNELDEMPTADVVSKGEVAGAVEKLMDATDKMISEVKVETAREIFEELETVFCYSVYPRVNRNGTITPVRSHHWHIRPDDYNAIKKKYTEGD